MKRPIRMTAAAVAMLALTGAGVDQGTPPMPHNPPITWNIGEYQMAQPEGINIDFRGGDRVNVFMATRKTSRNAVKCANWDGDGLILRKWKGRTWEVCVNIDFDQRGH